MKIAFVIEKFPAVSEPFIIDQVAALIDRGISVRIFSFKPGDRENISDKFHSYNMARLTTYINVPVGRRQRIVVVIPHLVMLLFKNPKAFIRAINLKKYGRAALSLKLFTWADALKEESFDLYHCHFGTVANRFLAIRDIFQIQQKFITTFYGFDVSRVFGKSGQDAYRRLKEECSMFFVMSEFSRQRIINEGFDPAKVIVHPAGIDMKEYPFHERQVPTNRPTEIISVGRFVEKKGFDDLLRALAIARKNTSVPFRCTIVGDGPLRQEILNLIDSLGLKDIIERRGYTKMSDIIGLLDTKDFFVQPSKTAADGNME